MERPTIPSPSLDKVSRSILGWAALGGVLALALLGIGRVLALTLYAITACIGAVLAIGFVARQRLDLVSTVPPKRLRDGLPRPAAHTKEHLAKPRKQGTDKRITGANVIDEPLQEVR